MARKIYEEVLTELRGVQGGISGLSQNDMARKFIRTPEGADGLSREEESFNTVLWPYLYSLLKSNKQLTSYEKQVYGKITKIWQINK